MIRGYTIEEFLGSGSFGAVARVRKHGLDYAMKAFLPGKADDEFRLEADILSQLDHPGIPAFVQTFTHHEIDYMVQEFIEGYPLSYYIFNGKIFGDEETLEILSQLLEILSYLHKPHNNRYPVIHRDLRLSNVFWFQNKAYIVDFGMARYLKERVSQSERPLKKTVLNIDRHRPGKKTYSALRAQVSPSSDLFGAGVVTLDLFANWIKDETQFKRPWQEIFPGSSRLKSFIEQLLLPEVQFPSARDALNSLEKIKDIKKPCN